MSRSLWWMLVAAALGGCYDWTLGAAPSDAGPDQHTAPPVEASATPPHDAAHERVPEAAPVPEAAHPVDVRAAEAHAPDVSPCPGLRAAVDAAQLRAENCMAAPADACQAHVADQCNCVVFVAQDSTSDTAAYIAAIQALKTSGCPLDCATCPLPPEGSLCLSSEVGGMLTESCSQ